MSKWPVVKLAEVCEVFDGPHATPKKTADGPWFLSISSLSNGRLDLAQSAHLSEEDFYKWTRRVTPRPGDVLFSYETRLGEAALMPEGLRACLGRRMGLLRPRRDKVDPRYLLYAYLGLEFQEQIKQRATHGATVDRIPIGDLPEWGLRLPPRDIQESLAAVLGTLDEKIVANKGCASKAIDLAFSVYAAAVANDAVQVNVGEVAEFRNRLRVPLSSRERAAYSGPFPYYGANGVIDYVGGYRFDGKHVLVGEDGTVIRDDGGPVVQYVRGKFWVSNHAHVLVGAGVSNEVLVSALKCADVRPYVTGAVQPKLSMGNLKRMSIVVPARSVDQLEEELRALYDLAEAKSAENDRLAELRDLLLPGLISGRVTVSRADKAAEETS